MKYATKGKRMMAIFDRYLEVTGKTAVTMEEVSEWAIKKALWPVPTKADGIRACDFWEGHLEAVTQ